LAQTPFLRKATGLVREASLFDTFIVAIMNMQVGMGILWILEWGPANFPKGDLVLSTFVTLILALFMGAAWALMGMIMPRSGGDYIFVSRVLHPALGFISSAGFIACDFFWIATLNVFSINPGLTTFFTILGNVDVATFLASNTGILTVGPILLVALVALCAFRFRYFLTFLAVTFVLGLGTILLSFALVAASSHEAVVSAFNAYSVGFGGMTYNQVLEAARSSLDSFQPSLTNNLGIMNVAFWALGYAYISTFLAGEIKRVERNLISGILAAVGISGILLLGSIWLYIDRYGYDFLYSIMYIYTSQPESYKFPVEPSFILLASTLTDNVIVRDYIGLSYFFWNMYFLPMIVIFQSRVAFAWSFDHLAPSAFADINPRSRSPLKAYAFFTIMGIVFLVVWTQWWGPLFGVFSATMIQVATSFLLVAISCLVIPYRKKVRHIYEASAVAKYKVLGIPLMTVVAIPYVLLVAIVLYTFLAYPWLGGVHIPTIEYVVAVIVLSVLYFFVARAYRKRQGIDVDALYREIPSE
jgi:APA family basic amino acid/polyamine antiporter